MLAINNLKHFKWLQLGSNQNHLVRKRTLNHLAKRHLVSLAKWLSVRLQTKWFWVRVQLQLLKLQILRLLRARSSLIFRQLQSVDLPWIYAYVTWEEHTVEAFSFFLWDCFCPNKAWYIKLDCLTLWLEMVMWPRWWCYLWSYHCSEFRLHWGNSDSSVVVKTILPPPSWNHECKKG